MEKLIFFEELKNKASKINVNLNKEQLEKCNLYMNLLLEWNEKMNLTAITDPKDIILKHFIDSFTIEKYIKNEKKVIDVGTGAGFPGIPISILQKDIDITLLDSLNKRIMFLEDVIQKLQLNKVQAVHARAEEFAKNKLEREQYDISTSRAVAPLNILLEYLLPLIKVGGKCVCMKGSNIEEIKKANNALKLLGGEIEKIEKINLPESDIIHHIIIIKKIKNTPQKYPRKSGIPNKQPII